LAGLSLPALFLLWNLQGLALITGFVFLLWFMFTGTKLKMIRQEREKKIE
jgi:hypothetical protein